LADRHDSIVAWNLFFGGFIIMDIAAWRIVKKTIPRPPGLAFVLKFAQFTVQEGESKYAHSLWN
jgi:hypothetical protein